MREASAPMGLPPGEVMAENWRSRGALLLQRCRSCGKGIFVPRSRCPACWSAELEGFESGGHGTVVTHATVHRGLPDELSDHGPITLAEIVLDDGVAMIARVVCEAGALATGDRVALVGRDVASRYPLPTFRRLGAAPAEARSQ